MSDDTRKTEDQQKPDTQQETSKTLLDDFIPGKKEDEGNKEPSQEEKDQQKFNQFKDKNAGDHLEVVFDNTRFNAEDSIGKRFVKDGKLDVNNMFQSYTELNQRMLETRPNAPKDIKEYVFDTTLEELGQTEPPEAELDAFRSWAQKNNFSVPQANEALRVHLSALAEVEPPAKDDVAQELQKQWGESYDANMRQVGDIAKRYGADQGVDVSSFGNNVALLKVLLNVSKSFQEGAGIIAKADPGRTVLGKKAAVNEILAALQNPRIANDERIRLKNDLSEIMGEKI